MHPIHNFTLHGTAINLIYYLTDCVVYLQFLKPASDRSRSTAQRIAFCQRYLISNRNEARFFKAFNSIFGKI